MEAELSYSLEHEVLELRFPYDTTGQRQRLAKSIAGWRWRSSKKAWEFPPTIDTAREVVAKFDPDAGPGFAEWWGRAQREREAAERALRLAAGEFEASGDFGFQFQTEPFENQLRYCEWAATRDMAGLTYRANFSQQGTGKTKMEIDMTVWELTRQLLRGMPVIFCPNSVKRNWVREINTHAPLGLFHPIMIDGSCAEKRALLEGCVDVLDRGVAVPVPIVNYEVLSHPSQREVLDQLMAMAESAFGKVIFDESTLVKNSSSNRGKAAYRLARRIPVRVVMTGTPYAKHLTDVFNQVKLLSPEILGSSWPAFYRHHVVLGGWQNKEVVGYRNQEELEQRVNRHAFRVLLEDCVDLPEEVNVERYCDLTKRQSSATSKLRKQMLAEMRDEDGKAWVLSAPNALTKLLRFNQITSGFLEDKTTERTTTFSPNPKLQLLMGIIKDEIPEDDKGVIWCCHQYDVEKIKEALDAAGIGAVTYYGEVPKDARDANEDRFNSDPECRFTIATPDAGGYGLNWQVANWALFYSYNFKWEAIDQARTRIRRATQRKKMTYIWLVAENPATRQASHGVSTGVNRYIIDNLAETSEVSLFMTGDFRKKGIDPKRFFRQALEVV